MSEALHRLVYRSTLAIEGSSDRVATELAQILVTSRDRNARKGLTGVLIHTELAVMQVLEGPRDALEEAYDRISADTRHTCFDLVQFTPVQRREFGDWRMGYVAPTQMSRFRVDGVVNAAAAPEEIAAALSDLGVLLRQEGEHDLPDRLAPITARAA